MELEVMIQLNFFFLATTANVNNEIIYEILKRNQLVMLHQDQNVKYKLVVKYHVHNITFLFEDIFYQIQFFFIFDTVTDSL